MSPSLRTLLLVLIYIAAILPVGLTFFVNSYYHQISIMIFFHVNKNIFAHHILDLRRTLFDILQSTPTKSLNTGDTSLFYLTQIKYNYNVNQLNIEAAGTYCMNYTFFVGLTMCVILLCTTATNIMYYYYVLLLLLILCAITMYYYYSTYISQNKKL